MIRICFALFIFSTAALSGCQKPAAEAKRDAKKPAPVAVTLTPVSIRPVQRSVEVFGTLWGDEDVTLSAKVSGRVLSITKDIGDRAMAGEVLAELEKTDYELLVRQKELLAREVLAKLNLTEFPVVARFDPAEVPSVQRAKLQAENAEAKFKRGQQLHDQDPPLLSDQDFADMKTTAAVARSAYDVELMTAKATLAEALSRRADLDVTRQRLADATVRVPGVAPPADRPATRPVTRPSSDSYAIAARMISVGEYVKEGTPLFRVVDDDPIKLRAAVPERFTAELENGQKVRVNIEAWPDDFWGEIARINPQIDSASRTFQIEVLIPNPDRRIKPGGFAKAWVQTRRDPNVLFVPRDAIQAFAGVNRVYVVKQGVASEISVELGQKVGNLVEVVSGLKGGESVITSGLNKIASGVSVVVSPK